mmetsp:Transcript_62037/g.184807  ORF Transcript_62037/g.184807 Transcript_62037/m.184807 type:complete len:295 (-) Transcript_62037:665-1549(-)
MPRLAAAEALSPGMMACEVARVWLAGAEALGPGVVPHGLGVLELAEAGCPGVLRCQLGGRELTGPSGCGRRRVLAVRGALRLRVLAAVHALGDPLPGLAHGRRDRGVHRPRGICNEPNRGDRGILRGSRERPASLERPAASKLGGQAGDVVGLRGQVSRGPLSLRHGVHGYGHRGRGGRQRPLTGCWSWKLEGCVGVAPRNDNRLLAWGAGNLQARSLERLLAWDLRWQKGRLPEDGRAGRQVLIVQLGGLVDRLLKVPHPCQQRGLVGHGPGCDRGFFDQLRFRQRRNNMLLE